MTEIVLLKDKNHTGDTIKIGEYLITILENETALFLSFEDAGKTKRFRDEEV